MSDVSNSKVMDYYRCVKDSHFNDGLNLSFSNDGYITQDRNEPWAVKIGATLLLGKGRSEKELTGFKTHNTTCHTLK